MKKIFAVLIMLLVLNPMITHSGSDIRFVGQGVKVYSFDSDNNQWFAIKRTDIDPNTSVNIAFVDPNGVAFTSRIIQIYADGNNTCELAVDLSGGTAVAPSANTAGDALFPPRMILIVDNFYTSSISVISTGTGNQTIDVKAWR